MLHAEIKDPRIQGEVTSVNVLKCFIGTLYKSNLNSTFFTLSTFYDVCPMYKQQRRQYITDICL